MRKHEKPFELLRNALLGIMKQISELSEVGGENRRFPDWESKPSAQRQRIALTARTTPQINGAKLFGGKGESRRFFLLTVMLTETRHENMARTWEKNVYFNEQN